MRLFRKRQDKSILINAAQYVSTVQSKPEAPHKLLKKSFFLSRLFGACKWKLSTRYGYVTVNTGDFVIRYSAGDYDVLSPKTFVKLYERI